MPSRLGFPWLLARPSHGARAPVRPGLLPRMATGALRVPDSRASALPLSLFATGGPQIFVHEGARRALERRLNAAFGGPVQLAVTDNRRRMVTQSKLRGSLRVRVHMMFLGAPDRVVDALVEYVVRGDRRASQVVGEYIDRNLHRIRASSPVPGPLRTRGETHDLGLVLADLNARYFGGALSDVLITWGRRTKVVRGEGRKTIKLGSYSAVERLIRVHPVLDKSWIPRYFLAYVVFHELLHHVVPAARVGGRSILHSPEFQLSEREFRHYERAVAWEQKHIGRLLRAR